MEKTAGDIAEVTSTNDIWVEKYRPRTLQDVEGPPQVLDKLNAMVSTGDLQHLLLAGPPGTGKTTSAHCMALALLGSDAVKSCVLELNASVENGVDVVRGSIKNFAKAEKSKLPVNRHKIVILDEADSMTSAAQQALRRIMEIYSNTTRFILICNNSSKIIEPIQSRCGVIRFSRLNEENILHRLISICKAEDVSFTADGLNMLIMSSTGDLRLAINNLQSTAIGFNTVTKENVLKVCDMPAPETVVDILSNCLNNNFLDARERVDNLRAEGYINSDISSVMKVILKKTFKPNGWETNLNDVQVMNCLDAVIQYSLDDANGINSKLRFDAMMIRLCELGEASS